MAEIFHIPSCMEAVAMSLGGGASLSKLRLVARGRTVVSSGSHEVGPSFPGPMEASKDSPS